MHRSLQDPTRSYKVLQDSTRSYKILQDNTIPYKILQDHTRSYKTLQGITRVGTFRTALPPIWSANDWELDWGIYSARGSSIKWLNNLKNAQTYIYTLKS